MRWVALAAIAGAAASGCAPLAPEPAERSSTAQQRSPVAQAQATHEYPAAGTPRQSAPGSASAIQAVTAFAIAYINWNARTVAADMQSLAKQSVGQARSAMELAAVQTASDYELQRGGIANSGTVEATAPLRAHRDQYVVVTREQTTATATDAYEGLQPAWHVAIATVVQVSAGRWAVSAWQPEG